MIPTKSFQSKAATGPKTVRATIVPGDKGVKANALLQRLSSSTYEGCRAKTLTIPSFPDFEPLVSELGTMGAETSLRERSGDFKVTTLMPCGSLVVKDQFFKQFLEAEIEVTGFEDLIARHNEKYNPQNIQSVEMDQSSAQVPAAEGDDKCPTVALDQPLTHEKLNTMDL